MENMKLQMGAIYCSYCNELIDTVDSEKVTSYFISCEKCRPLHTHSEISPKKVDREKEKE
ncbi:GapA-binding peptide SR1P [Paenibacillus alginolyticus]|uniref:GapA-binding peptide SR1P n=2 Tax=Paenibacillus alginolyticus TaxID=59839 RepID=UPI002E0D5B80